MAETKNELVKKILDGRREFVFENEAGKMITYYIADPCGEDVRKADWNYAKVFNQALADGFPTQAQMMDILVARGILSPEYKNMLEKTKIGLAAALYRLEHMSDMLNDDDKEALALETARLRDEFFKLNQKVNGPMGNTCENLAEDARNEYITSRVIENKDGTKLWAKYENYLAEERNALVLKCRFEVMAWLNGIESNFIDKMPETTMLRQLAEKRLEEALDRSNRLVAPDGPAAETAEPVVEEAKAVEDLELPAEPVAAKKPARGRPRARIK